MCLCVDTDINYMIVDKDINYLNFDCIPKLNLDSGRHHIQLDHSLRYILTINTYFLLYAYYKLM